jgi:hypothetical protein
VGLPKPPILTERYPDNIRFPIVDRHFHGIQNVPFAVGTPFQASRVDTAKPHWTILLIKDPVPLRMKLRKRIGLHYRTPHGVNRHRPKQAQS